MKFYVNKFPIKSVVDTNGKSIGDLPEGTIFKIIGINCGFFEMAPVSNIACCPILIGPDMLTVGFEENDYIDS